MVVVIGAVIEVVMVMVIMDDGKKMMVMILMMMMIVIVVVVVIKGQNRTAYHIPCGYQVTGEAVLPTIPTRSHSVDQKMRQKRD